MTKQIEHNCVVCDKPIKRIMTLPNDTDWQGCWNGGIVNKISAGYGSLLDGDMFILAICDECVKKKKLRNVGNYMFQDMPPVLFTTEDDVEIRKGDKYFTVKVKPYDTPGMKHQAPLWSIAGPYINPKWYEQSGYIKYFSTKDAAKKYIQENQNNI